MNQARGGAAQGALAGGAKSGGAGTKSSKAQVALAPALACGAVLAC
jgi:hypothetical protein